MQQPEQQPQQAHVVVHGRVQGVYYRFGVQQEAQANGTTGWVRNLPDGSVEAVVQGPTDRVQKVINWMRRGPRGAWVSSVDVNWSEPTTVFSSFDIAR